MPFSTSACFNAIDITKDAFSNPHSGIIDIASAHKLTITRSLNVTDGSFSASFITQSESDNDFPSDVRISRSSFSYKLTDWSSFFTLFTSLFAALKNPEALAENAVLIASLLFTLPLIKKKWEEAEVEVFMKVCVFPLVVFDCKDALGCFSTKGFVALLLLFLKELDEEETVSRHDIFALPLVDGKHSTIVSLFFALFK
tara:strand:- start:660 stop:1256 length:597 start_codon:yes stop_codon:yes gene_type:complete